MTSRVKLAVDVSLPSLARACRAMAARSRAVDMVDDVTDADAVMTDKADHAVSATESGKWVLQLNPFDVSIEGRRRLADSQRAMPGLIARFRPSIAEVQRALDEGRLGAPGLLRIHAWSSSDDIVVALSRELDLALWMFGESPDAVYAVERPGYLQVHLGFRDGGMSVIDVDTAVSTGNEYYSLSLIGATGAAYADDHDNMNLLISSVGTQAIRAPEADTALAAMIEHFALTVRNGTSCDPDWSETLVVAEAGRQVEDSVKRHVAVIGGSFHV